MSLISTGWKKLLKHPRDDLVPPGYTQFRWKCVRHAKVYSSDSVTNHVAFRTIVDKPSRRESESLSLELAVSGSNARRCSRKW